MGLLQNDHPRIDAPLPTTNFSMWRALRDSAGCAGSREFQRDAARRNLAGKRVYREVVDRAAISELPSGWPPGDVGGADDRA